MGLPRLLLRQMTRQSRDTAINLLGLGLGIGVFLVMALIAHTEYGYDSDIPDPEHIFRLDTVYQPAGQAPEESANSSFVMFPFLKQDIPVIDTAIRIMGDWTPVRVGDRVERDRVMMTDPDFFSVFHLSVIDGDPRTALDGPGKAVLSASTARRFFGTDHAVGRSFAINSTHDPMTVSAVYADRPANSSFDFGILTAFPTTIFSALPFTNVGSTWGQIWVRLRDPAGLAAFAAAVHDEQVRRPGRQPAAEAREMFGQGGIVPVGLRAVHFRDAEIGAGGAGRRLVHILLLVGLAALATACVNYVNLATARAGLRAREIAVRKVLGAPRVSLIGQFVAEALSTSLLGAVIGMSLCELALAWVNTLGGWQLSFSAGFTLPLAASIAIAVGLVSGAYPALLLSAYRPAPVLAASAMPSGGRLATRLRGMLVALQFGFAIILGICTLVMTHQARFVRLLDRGLHQDGLIIVDSLSDPSLTRRQAEIVARLAEIPGMRLATRSDIFPHHIPDGDSVWRAGDTRHVGTSWGFATPDYLEAMGATLLSGRLFDTAHGGDFGDGQHRGNTLVITRALAHALGFASPQAAIGAVLSSGSAPRQVVGVIEDMRLDGAHAPIYPLMLYGTRAPLDYVGAIVRYTDLSEATAMQRLHAAWERIAPDVPFSAESAPEIFADDYRTDRNHGLLFGIGSTIAIVIACLGLYGLSAFSVVHRRAEIGIRKMLGASTIDILVLLGRQFMRPVLIANLIAWPVSWALMRTWLAGFDQRITLTVVPFALTASVALGIAVATVLGQSLLAARQPPAVILSER